jgi:ATP-dependent helicase/nuclease subunit A
VEKMSLLHGRLLAATEEEMKESVDTILRVLEHPLLKQAAESDECHRELPILMQLDSETMVEGTIDLLFREGESWVVVDYKTDADIGERLSLYEKQIQWYGLGLSRARRCNQIRGVLLGI